MESLGGIMGENKYNVNLVYNEDIQMMVRIRGKTKVRRVIKEFQQKQMPHADIEQLTLWINGRMMDQEVTFDEIFQDIGPFEMIQLDVKDDNLNPEDEESGESEESEESKNEEESE